MPNPPKNRRAQCKAQSQTIDPPPEPPRKAPGGPETPPWVAALVDDACSTMDLAGAASRAGTTLAKLNRLRASEPGVDAALLEVDVAMAAAARAAVVARAAAGDLAAVRAIADGTLDRLAPSGQAQQLRTSPDVAAAMIAAGIAAAAGHKSTTASVTSRCPGCQVWLAITVSGLIAPPGPGAIAAELHPAAPADPTAAGQGKRP